MDSLVESRWPPGLAVMKTIDDLLRCGICFDYFNIAMMIPQCSHNYCSLCIRKFLSYKTQCPTCCVTVTEPDLKNNRILDELVKSLNFARSQSASMSFLQIVSVEHHSLLWFIPIKKLLHPTQPSATTTVTSQQPALRQYPQQQKHHHSLNHLLQFALESPPISPASSSSKNLAAKVNTPVAFRHSLKQGSRLMENFLIREMSGSTSELLIKENEKKLILQKEVSTSSKTKETPSIEKTAPRSLDAHVPETPSTSTLKQVTRVDCPVCGVNIPENHINKHLDSCLTRDEKKESLRSSVHKRKPLPKTVYNLLSDRDLKKKLKEHGLSIQGNKQQLIKRHQEFVHMYNAQCDALHPKSAAEIVQEIENMEKTRMRLEASKLNESIMVFTKDQTEKEIDEIHSRYRKKHQNEFRLLVDQAKKGYKKTVEMSKKKVTKEDDGSTEKLLPVFVEQEDKKMKFSDTSPITNHFSQSKLESPGRMEPDRPDDSSSCTDIQEEALSSSESDSFNSSSSDIIRDLLEEEEAWEASHKNDLDLQDAEMSPVQNRRTRSSENAEIEPSNKRNRN